MPHRPLKRIFDRQGEGELGWVSKSVLYGRMTGTFCAHLGERYASTLATLLQERAGAHVFLNWNELLDWDLLGRSEILRTFMAHRSRIAGVVILSSVESRRSRGPSMLAALGELVDHVVGQREFDRRLIALAPLAPEKVAGLRAEEIVRSPATSLLRRRVESDPSLQQPSVPKPSRKRTR